MTQFSSNSELRQPPTDSTEPLQPKKKRRPGFFTYLALVMLTLVLLLGGGYAVWSFSAKSQLAAARQKIIERGEPLYFADLAPAPVDPSLDGSPYFRRACALVVNPGEDFHKLLDGRTWGGPQPIPPAGPGDHPLFRQALAENQAALDMLREAFKRPYCRMQINYQTNQPIAILFYDIQKARTLAHLLKADVLQSLGTGDTDRAVEAVEEFFALSELTRSEPFLISQLVRIAIAGVAFKSLETTVAHASLTPEQFASLDAKLAKLQDSVRLKQAMVGERCSMMTTMENLTSQDLGLIGGGAGAATTFYRLLPPQMMEEQAAMLDLMTRAADTVDTPGAEGRRQADALNDDMENLPSRYVLSRMLLPATMAVREAGLLYRQTLLNARLGMRVDRYRAEHGALPERLEDVLDDQLKEIPSGLFSEKPLVYRVLDDGFTIYDVGENGIDEGGERQPDRQEGGPAFRVRYPAVEPENAGDS